MNKDIVSIIVPVYNVSRYIRECIDSILAQTYSLLDIVLVDDGSTDGSGDICDEYAMKDNRIKVIHSKNNGVSSARNLGITVSKGKYLYFVDPDDYLDETLIEKCIYEIKKHNCDIVQFGYKKVDDIGSLIYDKKLDSRLFVYNNTDEKISFICKTLLKYKIPIQPWSLFLQRKSVLNNNLCFIDRKIVFSEDVCFSVMLALNLHSTYTISESLYFFRKRAGSAMWNSKREKNRNLNEYNCMSKLIYERYKGGFSDDDLASIHNSLLMVRLRKTKSRYLKRQISSLSDKEYFYKMNRLFYSSNKARFCKEQGIYSGLRDKFFSKLLCTSNIFSYRVKILLLNLFIGPLYLLKRFLKR